MLNCADLPLSISCYRLLCKTLLRINVSIKKRKTHRWGGDLMFYLPFCYNANVHVAENVQQRPLGSHFSVGRRIRFNTGNVSFEFRNYCRVSTAGCGTDRIAKVR